jgi:hypothetical protein
VAVCRKKKVAARTEATEANWSTDSDPTRSPELPSRRAASSASAMTGSRMPMPMKKRDALLQKLV